MEKSSTGLEANIAGLLCYVLGWVSGLVFILIEKQSNFVRFHAIQSIYVFGTLTVAYLLLKWIPFLDIFIYLLAVALLIILVIKAYQGERFKLPLVGNWAEKTANSLK